MEQPLDISLYCLNQVRAAFPNNLEELIARGVLTRNTSKLAQTYDGTVECNYRAAGCTFACELTTGSVAISGTCYTDKIAQDAKQLMDEFNQQ